MIPFFICVYNKEKGDKHEENKTKMEWIRIQKSVSS